jgi:ABC-type dipeptide/oligopeptide/nickel transport system permease subunit
MSDAAVADVARRSRSSVSLNRWAGCVGGVILAIMLLACLGSLPYTLGSPSAAPGAAPRRYEATNLDAARLPPFWASHSPDERARLDALAGHSASPPRFVLGTDRLGRDLLVRLLAGGGISLVIGLAAALVAVLIGTSYGMMAGYLGGRIDATLMRAVDVLYGLPNVLLVVLLAVAVDGLLDRFGAHLGPAARQFVNVITLLLAIGGVTWLTMARVIRGQVLSLTRQPFMESCRAIGVPARRQLIVHLLPNLLGPILVYATLTVPTAILAESFLSFLGIGVKEPLPSWGNLAADGLAELNTVRSRWWMLLWPCVLIALTLLSLNFVGESLRERLDPRSRPRLA